MRPCNARIRLATDVHALARWRCRRARAPRGLLPAAAAAAARARRVHRHAQGRAFAAAGTLWLLARLLPWPCNHVRSEHRRTWMQAVLPNCPGPVLCLLLPSCTCIHCKCHDGLCGAIQPGALWSRCSCLFMLLDFVPRAWHCPGEGLLQASEAPTWLPPLHGFRCALACRPKRVLKLRLGVAQLGHGSPAPSSRFRRLARTAPACQTGAALYETAEHHCNACGLSPIPLRALCWCGSLGRPLPCKKP